MHPPRTVRLKPLKRQVVVIVGASSGIGLATARLAAARGAAVVAAARSIGALNTLVAEIEAAGGQAMAVRVDVANEAEVERIAHAAMDRFGVIDTWINCAAVSAYGSCLDVSVADMQRIMAVTYWGTVYGSRTACRHLHRRGGALINVGSVLSDRAVPAQGPYAAAKHAMKAFTDALRVELAYTRTPISVTLVKPSAIDTPYAEHARNYFADQPGHFPPVYTPRAVADAILYAAEHPIRDVIVGSAGFLLSWAGRLAPGLTDSMMARFFIPAVHTGRPPRGEPILTRPSEDLRERGDYPGIARPSLLTALVLHRRRALIAGAALLTALAGGRRWLTAPALRAPS